MKGIMLSIQPKYCELIASGKKTIKVSKKAPKLETSFKCYIYQSAKNRVCNSCNFCKRELGMTVFRVCTAKTPNIELDARQKKCIHKELMTGKIIGEFVCDKIYQISNRGSRFMIDNDIALTNRIARASCLQFDDLQDYLGAKDGYAWHITNLKIYDKPKELGEFRTVKRCIDWRSFDMCSDICGYAEHNQCNCGIITKHVYRPPRSWCYVEELSE